jgi:hypothetical protein
MAHDSAKTKRYLVASDFDQTLSFNDSGHVLSELVGIPGFEEKVAGLAKSNLVQQGAELAYLLRHDPEFRIVRREHLIEAGKRVRLKNNVDLLGEFFEKGLDSFSFQFYVISARPKMLFGQLWRGSLEPITFSAHSWSIALRPAKFLPLKESAQAMAKLPSCRNWKPSSRLRQTIRFTSAMAVRTCS